jgi:hypothetical protein
MTAVRENEIGRARCPICSTDRARLRVSAKSLAYITCDSCNAQVFARSDRSDEKLRALHVKEAAPAVSAVIEQAAPAPAAPAKPATVEPKRGLGWGVFA